MTGVQTCALPILKVELLDNSKDKEPIPVNLDGEIGGHLPIDFENLKQHIEFYVG